MMLQTLFVNNLEGMNEKSTQDLEIFRALIYE